MYASAAGPARVSDFKNPVWPQSQKVYFHNANFFFFFTLKPSAVPGVSLQFVTVEKISFTHSRCQSLWWGTCRRADVSLASFKFNGQLWGSVSNHNVQALNKETSQLPSSTMLVICSTENRALKQTPLHLCLTCGVQHKAKSPSYTLWCGIIWNEGGGGALWTSSIIMYPLSSELGQYVCTHNGGMFSVIMHCISSGWPFNKPPLFCDKT